MSFSVYLLATVLNITTDKSVLSYQLSAVALITEIKKNSFQEMAVKMISRT